LGELGENVTLAVGWGLAGGIVIEELTLDPVDGTDGVAIVSIGRVVLWTEGAIEVGWFEVDAVDFCRGVGEDRRFVGAAEVGVDGSEVGTIGFVGCGVG